MSELTRRYVVMTMAAETPFDTADPEGVFVLKPWKDPAALRALIAYRDNCYPELGQALDAWIRAIGAGPVVRGDVGRRNEPHVKPAGDARPAPARRARPARPAGRSRRPPKTARATPRTSGPKRKKRRR
jgi:hypothetical protein